MKYLVIKTDNGYFRDDGDRTGYWSWTNDASEAYMYKMQSAAESKADKIFQKFRKLTFAKVVEVEATAVEKKTLYEVKG
jgi:hypothetical protein